MDFNGPNRQAIGGRSAADIVDIVRSAVPPEHVEFLESFADSCRFGDYLFVHAGIRPGVQLEQQSQSDLRWIREPFLFDDSDHGFVVVHGHTSAIGDVREQAAGFELIENRHGCGHGGRSLRVPPRPAKCSACQRAPKRRERVEQPVDRGGRTAVPPRGFELGDFQADDLVSRQSLANRSQIAQR